MRGARPWMVKRPWLWYVEDWLGYGLEMDRVVVMDGRWDNYFDVRWVGGAKSAVTVEVPELGSASSTTLSKRGITTLRTAPIGLFSPSIDH